MEEMESFDHKSEGACGELTEIFYTHYLTFREPIYPRAITDTPVCVIECFNIKSKIRGFA